MRTALSFMRQFGASLRMLVIFTVLLGVGYPLLITAIAQLPGLKSRADGSTVAVSGQIAGSSLIGQSFIGADGAPLPQYFQSRPSAAGAGYDPTASGASNLGPESIVDTLPDPTAPGDTGTQSLLTTVCARSLAVGELEGVDGSRPFCATVTAADGSGTAAVGAVVAVFYAGPGYTGAVTRVVAVNESSKYLPFLPTYDGVAVQTATFGEDYSKGQIVPIRGDSPANPAVPADAVTASGSGLDPEISPAYADIQIARVAAARGITAAQVRAVVGRYEDGPDLGFLGAPRVNVLRVNLALDAAYPLAS